MPPSLVLVIAAAAVYAAFGASVPPTDPATAAPCAILEDRCQCTPDLQEFVCRTAGFTEVPHTLPYSITKLDLTSNNITALNETSLSHYTHMEELTLSENKLESIHPKSFAKNVQLKRLLLQGCALSEIPVEVLRPLSKLQTLNIGNNLINALPPAAFPSLDKLVVLLMKRNQISEIAEEAFANLTSLKVLELDDNFLTEIPAAVTKLAKLQELSISGNRIKYIRGGLLQKTPALALLELKGNPLTGVDAHAFSFLPRLRKLILSEARELSTFPNLNGTTALEILRLDRAGISSVPSTLCTTCPRLKSLDLKSNKLKTIPDLNDCREMRVLDLASNHIRTLENRPFRGMYQMHDLLLAHNEIQYIPQDAFYNLSRLQVLNLEDNQISFIHPDAFLPISKIEDLNLGQNVFPHLPSAGLERLLHLKTFNNPNLREFPPPEEFPRIQTLVLAYAYHCCAFLPLIPSNPPPKAKDFIVFPDIEDIDMNMWNSSLNDYWPSQQNLSHKFGKKFETIWENLRSDFTYPGNFPSYMEEYAEEEAQRVAGGDGPPGKIQCLPLPGPFLPCQDLFDWWTLRCGVWIVFLCAMLGNGTVVFVLIFSRGKMDVPRFLVCNLAAADFFMGIYLGFLAVVDASTLGEFRMYAIPWQMSAGCQLSGFLGVLSSELSVYTLAVITLERNYAITHAMHLNKRLSLKHAGYIMICGWSFAIVMGLLPLFSVSDYRKFAVCLPFETKDAASLTYVVFLMFINGVAFLILMGCYLKMYCAIRGSQAWNSNDSRIAKRMALLVFTDFLCWSPIAFFSLTAAFGLQLISLEQAKVFTVFVLPLNSCCNPFLYAILTKQFKKDCVMICKAIEESRVTRGIGRCRHSSNFSNRQTPANTNSLADRSSRENQNHVPTCTCNVKLLGERSAPPPRTDRKTRTREWLLSKARWLLCVRRQPRHRPRSDQYTYQIAEIQQKQHKRASSVSSSENFSSSRSDSWRHNHHCGIPLRLLDPKRRASSWLVTRKTSQDSNLSSSRNDSSGSATTASTSTWRMSRSSASSEPNRIRAKPRLTRQSAIQDEADLPGSPGRLTVRFLTTIPSAAETSMQMEDEQPAILVSPSKEREGPLYAILHSQPVTPARRQSIVTLHPPETIHNSSQPSEAGPSR
ncbi:lutropin-choriogonadotropic hormone receptor isoform X3 [Tribolium castaneum]|uniref:lutropin-choriogonadotropic hormone receptor isoform X3 n=1 Tax=Tribolium castaneum TaxID=7070 RepID=UPI00046BF741|nr:PREDICTED: lutropin-choriogonadotropic hormone receptor isoform X3 [Tribolium castaneum]|eukprot:XP_008192240.1 PREDICTED: lutropin-choriogonadotropic hormone receptor isoform X3 [Tribolium castaneum]